MGFPRISRRSVVAFLALSLVGVSVWGRGRRDALPIAVRHAAGPPVLEVVARVPVGGEPIGIVEGFGSVWVVNSEFDSGGTPSVSRVDPAVASVEATVSVGALPLEVAAAFGAIWVTNSEDDTVSRIDPAKNEVVATIKVCGAPEGMAADQDGLWVVCEESAEVLRIDPNANRAGSRSGWVSSPGS